MYPYQQQTYPQQPMQQMPPQLQFRFDAPTSEQRRYHPQEFASFMLDLTPCDYIQVSDTPHIAAELASAFSLKSARSPAHMYTFNENCANNWSNMNFLRNLERAFYYANMSLTKRLQTDIQQAIVMATEKISQYAIAENILGHREFAPPFIPVESFNAANNVQPEIVAIKREINDYVGQMQNRMRPQGGQGQQQWQQNQQPWQQNQGQGMNHWQQPPTSVFQQQNQFQQPPNVYSNRQYPHHPQPMGRAGQSNAFTSGVFNNHGQPTQQPNVSQQQDSGGSGRYAYLVNTPPPAPRVQQPPLQPMPSPHQREWVSLEPAQAQQPMQTQVQPPMHHPVQQPAYQPVQPRNYQAPQDNTTNIPAFIPPDMEEKKLGMIGDEFWEIDWTQDFDGSTYSPEPGYPYPPAINTRTQVLIKITKNYGTNKARVRYIAGDPSDYNVTEEQMNRNHHYVTPITQRMNEFTPQPKPVDLNAITTEEDYVAEVTKPTHGVTELIDDSMFDNDPDIMPPVMSVREAVVMCDYTHKAHGVNSTSLSSTRLETAVQKFFFSQEDHGQILLDLGKTNTFSHLSSEMNKITGNRSTSKELMKAMASLDNYLKNKLLHTLRYKLGISNFTFDSFAEDAPDVIGHLKKTYGVEYARALQERQKEFIQTYLAPTDSVRFEEEGNEDGVKENVIKINGVQEAISVTCIDLSSDQLNVKVKTHTASLVSQTFLPNLNDFIGLTTDIALDTNERFGAHYLLTNDDRLFELHKGYLSTDTLPSYLINEVILD